MIIPKNRHSSGICRFYPSALTAGTAGAITLARTVSRPRLASPSCHSREAPVCSRGRPKPCSVPEAAVITQAARKADDRSAVLAHKTDAVSCGLTDDAAAPAARANPEPRRARMRAAWIAAAVLIMAHLGRPLSTPAAMVIAAAQAGAGILASRKPRSLFGFPVVSLSRLAERA